MDVAQLVLDYLKALAWPLVVLALAFGFKRQLQNLIDGISEITAPGNISFKRRLAAVRADAEMANDDTAANVGESGAVAEASVASELQSYWSIAEHDPVGAISGSWRVVRHIVRDVTRQLGTDRELQAGAYTASHLRTLVPLGLSEDMINVCRQLSGLRNDVVHGRKVTTDSETATSFLSAADDLVNAVRVVAASRS